MVSVGVADRGLIRHTCMDPFGLKWGHIRVLNVPSSSSVVHSSPHHLVSRHHIGAEHNAVTASATALPPLPNTAHRRLITQAAERAGVGR